MQKINQMIDSSNRRLVVRQVEMINFKSYYGKVNFYPDQNFSFIIGQNGTGKSNFFDAILFLVGRHGEQIRSKKLGDLIYRDPQQKIDTAQVMAHFASINIPQGEQQYQQNKPFTLKRWVKKKPSSSGVTTGFILNGQAQKFQQVRQYLLIRGLDMNIRHNIIIQHQISDYAMLRPKALSPKELGFCQIFERAIGIDFRNERKKQLQSQVRQLQRIQCENLGNIQVNKKQLKKLEPQLQNDVNENNETRQVNLLRYLLSSFEYMKVNRQYNQIYSNFKSLNQRIEKIKEEKKKESDEIDRLAAHYNKLINLNDQLQQQRNQLFYTMNKKKQSVDQAGSQTNELEAQHKKLLEKQQKLEQNFESMKQDQNEKKMQINFMQIKKQIQDAQKQLQEQEMIKKQSENEVIEKREPIIRKIRAIQNRINPIKNQINRGMQAVKQNLEQQQALHRTLQMQQKDFNKLQQEGAEMINRIENAQNELQRVKQVRAQVQRSLLPLTRDSQKQSDLLLPRQQQLNQLNVRLKDLRQIQKSQSNNLRVQDDQIVQLVRRDGRIPTFMGRLDSLGHINEQYHDAALAAAGRTLFSYVVQTREDMKKFMALCKDNNKRAGILCYEIIKERNQNLDKLNLNKVKKEGKEIPRIISLIKAKNKTASFLFKFAFTDTLIAEDFDTAHVIAYKGSRRERVVTLNGDVLQKNGTVKTVPKGAYSYQHTFITQVKMKVGEEEIKSLAADIQNFEAQCNQRQANINNYQREIYRLKQKMPQEGIENKFQWDIEGYKRQLEHIEREMGQQRENQEKINRIKRDIEQLKRQNAQIRNQIEDRQQLLAPLKSEKQSLQEQQQQLQGDNFNKILNAIQVLKKQVQDLIKQKITVAEQIKFAEFNLKSLQKQIKDTQKQIDGQVLKMEKLKNRRQIQIQELQQNYKQNESLEKRINQNQNEKQEYKRIIVIKKQQAFRNSDQQQRLRVLLAQQQIKVQKIKGQKDEKKREVKVYLDKNTEISNRRKRLLNLQKKTERCQLYFQSIQLLKQHVNVQYLSKGRGISEQKLEQVSAELFEKYNRAKRKNEDDDDDDDDDQDDDNDEDDDDDDNQDEDNDEVDDEDLKTIANDGESSQQRIQAKKILNTLLKKSKGIQMARQNCLVKLQPFAQQINGILDKKSNKARERKNQFKKQQRQEKNKKKIASSDMKRQSMLQQNNNRNMTQSQRQAANAELFNQQDDEQQQQQNSNEEEISYFHTYQKRAKEYIFILKRYKQSLDQRLLKHSQYHNFNTEIRERFDRALPQIQRKISTVYKEMTNGQLHIQPINQYGYDLQGLQIHVKPPFSVWINRQFLSGGQKTMIALSVVLGLHLYRPSPFFLFDEVDASLDSTNVETLTRFVARIQNSQFFMISHREQGAQFAPHFILVKPVKVTAKHMGVNIEHLTYEQALELKRNYLNDSNYQNNDSQIRAKDLEFIAISGRRNRLLKRDQVLTQYIEQFGFVDGYDKFLQDEARQQEEEDKILQKSNPLMFNHQSNQGTIRYSFKKKNGEEVSIGPNDVQKFLTSSKKKKKKTSRYVLDDSDEDDDDQGAKFEDNLFKRKRLSQNIVGDDSISRYINQINSGRAIENEKQQLNQVNQLMKQNLDQQILLQGDDHDDEDQRNNSNRRSSSLLKKSMSSRKFKGNSNVEDDDENFKESQRVSNHRNTNGYEIIFDGDEKGVEGEDKKDEDDDYNSSSDEDIPYYQNKQKSEGVTFKINQQLDQDGNDNEDDIE